MPLTMGKPKVCLYELLKCAKDATPKDLRKSYYVRDPPFRERA